jgi:hypothetical protein
VILSHQLCCCLLLPLTADTIDEDLVDSIVVPAGGPSAAEVFYRINVAAAAAAAAPCNVDCVTTDTIDEDPVDTHLLLLAAAANRRHH